MRVTTESTGSACSYAKTAHDQTHSPPCRSRRRMCDWDRQALMMLARLSQALARARAVPLVA